MFNSLQQHELQQARLPWFFTISQNLLRFVSTELVMLSNRFNLCCPLHILSLISPSIRGWGPYFLGVEDWQSIKAGLRAPNSQIQRLSTNRKKS